MSHSNQIGFDMILIKYWLAFLLSISCAADLPSRLGLFTHVLIKA